MKSWISSYHCIVLEVYQDSKVSSDTPINASFHSLLRCIKTPKFLLIHLSKKLIQFMNNQSRTKFWFKPSSLRRHNVAGIGNIHQLFH